MPVSANRQALAALHQDEDFQSDLLRLPIQRVIDDTKKNPENYEKCVTRLCTSRASSCCCTSSVSLCCHRQCLSDWRVSSIVVHKHEIQVSPSHRHIQNPEIARALEKIRRFHAVVKANGGTTVDLVQMAAGNAETAAVGVPGYPQVTQHARY